MGGWEFEKRGVRSQKPEFSRKLKTKTDKTEMIETRKKSIGIFSDFELRI
jgi:hypothetical protein